MTTTETASKKSASPNFARNLFVLVRRNFVASLDREFLVIQLVLPLFFIFVAGFGYTLIVPGVEGVSYETFLATGAVAMTVMSSSMLSGTMIWFDRNFGMFEQILMGPFTRLQYVLSVALSVVLTGLASALIVFIVSLIVSAGVIISAASILQLLAALILGSLFFGGFGIFISLRVKSSEALAATMNLTFFIFTFLSSVFYPSRSSFLFLRVIFEINPLTYVADLIRNGLLGLQGFSLPLEVILLIVESAAMVFFATRSINRIEV
ncbi:MAG TPA: ABC transporter permease [Nitrososphaerales archaeon]|nr:ABC transporter permease [Nitrososphaerales archaeon]